MPSDKEEQPLTGSLIKSHVHVFVTYSGGGGRESEA